MTIDQLSSWAVINGSDERRHHSCRFRRISGSSCMIGLVPRSAASRHLCVSVIQQLWIRTNCCSVFAMLCGRCLVVVRSAAVGDIDSWIKAVRRCWSTAHEALLTARKSARQTVTNHSRLHVHSISRLSAYVKQKWLLSPKFKIKIGRNFSYFWTQVPPIFGLFPSLWRSFVKNVDFKKVKDRGTFC